MNSNFSCQSPKTQTFFINSTIKYNKTQQPTIYFTGNPHKKAIILHNYTLQLHYLRGKLMQPRYINIYYAIEDQITQVDNIHFY